jgi:hypothetical protein
MECGDYCAVMTTYDSSRAVGNSSQCEGRSDSRQAAREKLHVQGVPLWAYLLSKYLQTPPYPPDRQR